MKSGVRDTGPCICEERGTLPATSESRALRRASNAQRATHAPPLHSAAKNGILAVLVHEDSRRLPGARAPPGPGRGPPRPLAGVLEAMSFSRPGAGRGPLRRVAGVVVGRTLPVFFTPLFLCSRRVALRWFVLAVPLMFLVFMLLKGLPRPARRLLPGAAGQC